MGTTSLLFVITLVALAGYTLWGAILSFHWVRYGASWQITMLSIGSYAVAGLYLFGAAFAAIIFL